jgi:hypothetical protein
MLNIFNLKDTVYFPIRIVNNSATLIDNIFIDIRRNYSIEPCINRLSDHDAQLITFKNCIESNNSFGPIHARNINNINTEKFQKLLI